MPLQTRVAFDHMKLPGNWSIQLPCDIPASAFPALRASIAFFSYCVRWRTETGLGSRPKGNKNAPGSRGAAIAEIRVDLGLGPAHARSAPEAFAVWVAMKSIRGGDRQS